MIVGLTAPMKEGPTLELYVNWLKGNDPDVDVRVLSHIHGNAAALAGCDALVLSGGNDVHPQFYGRMDAWNMMRDVDEQRDRFEMALIASALEACLPVLGICRGAQIFNVALGGSLVPDLPSAGFQDHGKGPEGNRVHDVTIAAGSRLRSIAGCDTAEVNTSHHQAMDRPGKGLAIVARSTDGVAEAAEWEEPEGKPFVLLVQWHPERMTDVRSPVAGTIRQQLITHLRSTPHHQT
jgi:putative glutamine amidotransferase